MKKPLERKEEISEDLCFICKDGGLLFVCDHKHCLKAYHRECLVQDKMPSEDAQWFCSWHSCILCHKKSKFKCCCCPAAFCDGCIGVADFAHVRGGMGFCRNCLGLVVLIEENRDEDSDGGKVDFADRETYEFLFKDYWEIVKEKEQLELDDIIKADLLLKKGRDYSASHYLNKFADDKEFKLTSGFDKAEGDIDNVAAVNFVDKSPWLNKMPKRSNLKRREFVGWGSKELLTFLMSIGKDVDKPIPQQKVDEIVMQYIQQNKLLKRRSVKCDAKLLPLLGRRVVNRNKISHLLDLHFAENQAAWEESSSGSMDEATNTSKSMRKVGIRSMANVSMAGVKLALITSKSKYASIISKNINLIYLRRTLIEELLKDPDTFKDKMVGSFVRVRTILVDQTLLEDSFLLVQVAGVEKVPKSYKVGESLTDVILRVSDFTTEIRISSVSDDSFTEEECENLRWRINEGLLTRPRLVDMEKKVQSLHVDIMNHVDIILGGSRALSTVHHGCFSRTQISLFLQLGQRANQMMNT